MGRQPGEVGSSLNENMKMGKAKIALYLSEQTPEDKIRSTTTIHSSLVTNVVTFPEPNPALTSYLSAISNVEKRLEAISMMEHNLETERSLLKGDLSTLDSLTGQLASYVENIANGNPATLQLAGFELASEPVPIGQLSPPQDLRCLTADIDGQVNLKWTRVRGATSYFVECATDPTAAWTQADVTTRSSTVAMGLKSGTKYWFRVRALGAAGYSGWSASSQKMAA